MSNILSLLRDSYLSQRDESELMPMPAGLINQAEQRISLLKAQYQTTGDDDAMQEHEAIVTVMDGIQEHRADLIWAMAYTQADDTRAMTDRERDLFSVLRDMAANLRGIS